MCKNKNDSMSPPYDSCCMILSAIVSSSNSWVNCRTSLPNMSCSTQHRALGVKCSQLPLDVQRSQGIKPAS
jgi:hypothetical protein